jgi:electron transfer flavoprotein beta subunit
MRILCLVKFVPDPDHFSYDYERNILIREQVTLTVNPDDARALAFALKLKAERPDAHIEIVSMAPASAINYMRDLLQRGADRGVLLSDRLYAGSDTFVTAHIIARYLRSALYDVILCGTHSFDGDTAHIPSQLAELLGVTHLSGVASIDADSLYTGRVQCEVSDEETVSRYQVELPAILSVSGESKYKLPFIKYADLEKNVDEQITILTNQDLRFSADEVGLRGSLTSVSRTFVKVLDKKNAARVQCDDAGIEQVWQFLHAKGFV